MTARLTQKETRKRDLRDTGDTEPLGDWRSSSGEPFNPEFHQTCDDCGKPGMSDSDGFLMGEDGRIRCLKCDDSFSGRIEL